MVLLEREGGSKKKGEAGSATPTSGAQKTTAAGEEGREGKKAGRPSNAERLAKEKTPAAGKLVSMLKRQLSEGNKEGDKEEEGVEREGGGREREGREEGTTKNQEKQNSIKIEDIRKLLKEEREVMKEQIRRVIREENEEIRKEMKEVRRELERDRTTWSTGLREIEEKTERMEKEKEEQIKELKEQIKALEKERDADRAEAEGEATEITERVSTLEEEIERKERQERRNNIVIKGEEVESCREAVEAAKKLIQNMTGEGNAAEIIYEIGSGKGKRVVAKLRSWEIKRKIMSGKGVLRGRKIYIDDDLTKKEREIQREIVARAREEREQGKRCKIGYQKLEIGEEKWTWNNTRKALTRRRSRGGQETEGEERGREEREGRKAE